MAGKGLRLKARLPGVERVPLNTREATQGAAPRPAPGRARPDAAPTACLPRNPMEPDMELRQPGDGWDYDYVDDDVAHLETPALAAPSERRAGGGGWFHLALGAFFVVAAVVVALPPGTSSGLNWVGDTLRAYGLETGVLGLAGLIFWSMAFAQRSIRAAALAGATRATQSGESDLALASDQIVTDLEQILTAVLRTNDELSVVCDSQRVLVKELLEEKEPGEKEHDAIFRLAASLDKLAARVDTRLHEFDVQFRSRFEAVSASVHEARLSLETRVDALLPTGVSPAPVGPAGDAGREAPAPPGLEFFEQIEQRSVPHAMGPEDPDPALPSELEMEALDALLPDDDPSRG